MPDDFGLTLLDRPVAFARSRRADAELAVHSPGLRVAGVVRVVEDRDVRKIGASFDLQTDVDPQCALALGAFVALSRRVDDLAGDSLAPRHAQEEPAIVVLADGHVGPGFASPFQIQLEGAVPFAHRPALGVGQDVFLRLGIEQVVDGLPSDLVATLLRDGGRDSPPVVARRIVEEVATVEPGEAPVEAGLVLVVLGAEFGDQALPVRSGDRMQVGPCIRSGILREDGLAPTGAKDRQGPGSFVLPDRQSLLRWRPTFACRAPAIRATRIRRQSSRGRA